VSDIITPYREGLARGELLIQSCNACATKILYPRHRCTNCQSDDLGFVPASGAGTLHSYTVVRAVPPRGYEDDVPYALGVVKLDEGVQLLARLHPDESGDWESYRCDLRVRFSPVSAEEIERRPVAWFGPEGADG
jgi:uncharacterized OB-fold protein